MSIILMNLSGFPHLNVFMSHAFRVEFRVHLRKEKWLHNLSIISKDILSIEFDGLHCTTRP
ncbi:hypothetical protein T01_14875 [Trichinella spiralis]|uniref:Uncharacterized protein n=1 Tax=Trichinella spiralis TaxID=6334 RepID=A0A0V1AJB9_TRISP|nr:hypothetical protein T01_14875 [Trichinella spiralis]